MKSVWTRTILVSAAMMLFSLSPAATIAQNANTNRNATAKGQMKSSGQEARSAGVGLGKDVRHGHVVHGTRHFGAHTYRAGKHFGKGTGIAAKKTGNKIKNTLKH